MSDLKTTSQKTPQKTYLNCMESLSLISNYFYKSIEFELNIRGISGRDAYFIYKIGQFMGENNNSYKMNKISSDFFTNNKTHGINKFKRMKYIKHETTLYDERSKMITFTESGEELYQKIKTLIDHHCLVLNKDKKFDINDFENNLDSLCDFYKNYMKSIF
jgi:hypothetical protein